MEFNVPSLARVVATCSALLYILNGSLWIYWLRSLETHEDVTKKCYEVYPTLRVILLVLAWLGIVSTSFLGFRLLLGVFNIPDGQLMVLLPVVLMLFVMVALFTSQIVYIRAIETSHKTVADNCTEIEHMKRFGLTIAAALVITIGLFSLFNTLLHNDTLENQVQKQLSSADKKKLTAQLKAMGIQLDKLEGGKKHRR